MLLSGCRNGPIGRPIGRFFRGLDAARDTAEILAWGCSLVFGLFLLVAAIIALVKTRRAPTERSCTWARRLGIVHLAAGLFLVFGFVVDPPRGAPTTATVPSDEVEEVATRGGALETRPVYDEVDVPGDVDVGAMLGLIALGLGIAAFGAATYRSGRNRRPREQ